MAARMAGSRKTPDRVVQLIQEEVMKTSQAATARATGLTLRGVQNYLKGIGEPTTATLEKLEGYFGVTVAELRGENPIMLSDYIMICLTMDREIKAMSPKGYEVSVLKKRNALEKRKADTAQLYKEIDEHFGSIRANVFDKIHETLPKVKDKDLDMVFANIVSLLKGRLFMRHVAADGKVTEILPRR